MYTPTRTAHAYIHTYTHCTQDIPTYMHVYTINERLMAIITIHDKLCIVAHGDQSQVSDKDLAPS